MQLIVNITKQIPNASERFPNTDITYLNISTKHKISPKHKTRHFDNMNSPSVSYTSLQYNRAIYFIREKIRRDLHKTRD